MKTWDGNYVSLSLESDDVDSCAHQGACDENVEGALRFPYIAEQLDALSVDDIRAELKEYGAWDASELEDEAQNRARLLWVFANNIKENDDACDDEEDADEKMMRTITKEQWQRMPRDYKSIINGQRYILSQEGGKGTCLVPVNVEGLKPRKP